ncbi:MFS transporter [Bartonella vinsonii]|uniref:2-acyl-glycerophospho-ethanolamine acyltransferase n=1 Tax=Bartonella vinsonii TaxID=33047 RepID=A0A3S4YHT4_BARVI|nr:MFS transporter [Bartonella vinsonii]VEJ45908.1 2-acyl-glycerophospho-ethanolamine acyltransferase [Bartonella vinsonii]
MNLFLKKSPLSLFFSLFISKVGDTAYEVIFILLVLELTDNYFFTGLVYFFRFIPFLFFGPIGGWLADNFSLKKNMIFSEFVRLLASFFVFITSITETTHIIVLIFAAICTTIGRSLFQPSFQAAIPRIFSINDLTKANSISQIIEETASLIGPLVCSVLLFFANKSTVLIFDLFTYFLSIIVLFNLTDLNSNKKKSFHFIKIYRETVSYLKDVSIENNNLFITLVGSSFAILFTGAILRFLIPAFVLSKGGEESFVSSIFSLIAVGTLIGGLLYSKIIFNITSLKLMVFWLLYGVIMFIIPLVATLSLKLLLVLAFVLGFIGAFVDISLVSSLQLYSRREDLGKSFGTFSTLANSAEAMSGFIAGLFALVGLMSSFLAMSALIISTGMIGVIKMKKKKERTPLNTTGDDDH